jgi:putative acetyltransferase
LVAIARQRRYVFAMIIRRARPEDAPILAAAEREIAKTPGQLASKPEELRDEWFLEKIIALSEEAAGVYLVVEQDKKIAGHAFLERHKLTSLSHVVTLTMAIHEGHQGQGFGKALMRRLIEWAKANPEIEKFELQVRSGNTRAIALYKSFGFVEEGRKIKRIKYAPNYYVDDVYMALWVGD